MRRFEALLLRMAYEERDEVKAYNRLMESSIPKSSITCPGTTNIKKMARVYFGDHQSKGEKLPYFMPFNISELNIFANITRHDFVIYRQCGRRTAKKRPLVVVADTRLFSSNPPGSKCGHVVIEPNGLSRKLCERGKKNMKVSQMMPNVSCKNAEVFDTPDDFIGKHGSPSDEPFGFSFLDMKRSIDVLDKFSQLLNRSVRLMAVNCTSRFRRTEKNAPRTVRCVVYQQRTAVCGAGPPLTLCLQAVTSEDGESFGVQAVSNLPPELCGPRKAGNSEGKARRLFDIKTSDLACEKEEASVEKPERKMTAHTRIDPCCYKPKEDLCEACQQMSEQHKKGKMPPIETSRFMYNPLKSPGGSVAAEARSLGLFVLFPWLEDALFKMSLISCISMDIETLNVPVGEGSAAGVTTTLTDADEIPGGTVNLTRHVPFVVGSTMFRTSLSADATAESMLRHINSTATEFFYREVVTDGDVPGQEDVSRCVLEWLDEVGRVGQRIAKVKRDMIRPVLELLEGMRDRAEEHLTERGSTSEERFPSFGYSVYGRLLFRLNRLCDNVNVITYNGSKFDLVNLLSPLISAAKKLKLQVKINRKGLFSLPLMFQAIPMLACFFLQGTEIRFLTLGSICFYDLFKLSMEATLKRLGELLGISDRVEGGLQKDYSVPYMYFSCMSRLNSKETPPLDDPCWASMKNGEPMCTEKEHGEIAARVASVGWRSVFTDYLKDVSLSASRSRNLLD